MAAGDGAADRSSPLARYYAESGTPPGRFLGSGLADLDGGKGVDAGMQVTEEHLRLMLVALADPVSGEPVGGAPKAPKGAAPVAGFDLCFSPPKSVSVAWALADPETKAIIYDCHLEAINYVLAYAEREVFHSRSGKNGIVCLGRGRRLRGQPSPCPCPVGGRHSGRDARALASRVSRAAG